MDSRLFEDLITPLAYFYRWEKERPNDVFLRQPYGETWKNTTFGEAGQAARKLVSALQAMGLKKGDHIGIISKNCYHWVIADLAIMMGGYVSTPFYANLSAEQLSQVLPKSDTKAVFVGKLDSWDNIDAGIPADMPIIKFPHYEGNAKVTRGNDWDEVLQKYSPVEGQHEPAMSDMWTILFTSGTTGTPKGVVHDYENASLIIRNEVLNNNLKVFEVKDPSFFSFLPLNHIAERTAVELAALMCGAPIAFAESLETFGKNLQDIQPTLFFAVPRIWTKFYMAVLAKMPQEKLDRMLRIPIISTMVKKKIKKTLGLSKATLILTGASITPENLKQWYRRLGINLREVYGMTENFGGFTLMPEFGHRPHTVGRPVSNAEGRIHAETGEILMKMPWMMKGYYKEPELTAEVLVDDWLHTGDKGTIDEDGYFKIVGRVKDAFKTSKGKFIVPTELENHFSDNDFIEQICVAGLGIAQPVALINLSEIALGLQPEQVTSQLEIHLKEINSNLHGHERISTVIIAKEAWSPDNNMLTPTLKIRRGAIDECYMPKYEPWHEDKRSIIWED